ncbi:MAG: 30S ribosome-binding factor RbfA [Pseudohongiellaceae bacterium]
MTQLTYLWNIMQRASNRLEKINDLLKRELALLIQNEVRDPRVGMASITEVRVSRDLSYADVYVTILGKSDASQAAESMAALNRAGGFLRSLVAKNINLRTTPKFKFIFDDSIARGQHLSSLIDEALARDRNSHSSDDD